MSVEAFHWSEVAEQAPEVAAFRQFAAEEASTTLEKLIRADPGSALQTRLVGEFAALVRVANLDVAVQALVARKRAQKQAETQKLKAQAAA